LEMVTLYEKKKYRGKGSHGLGKRRVRKLGLGVTGCSQSRGRGAPTGKIGRSKEGRVEITPIAKVSNDTGPMRIGE